MYNNFRRVVLCGLAAALAVVLITTVVACSSSSTSATSVISSSTLQPSGTNLSQTPTNSGSMSRRSGANGTPSQNQSTSSAPSSSSPTPTSVPSANSIGVFSDVACTQPVTKIEWGTLAQGNSSTQTVFLEDLSTQNITINTAATGLASGLDLTADTNPLSLTDSQTLAGYTPFWKLTLTLTATGNAASGDCNFTTSFASLQIPSHVSITQSISSTPSTTITTPTISTASGS